MRPITERGYQTKALIHHPETVCTHMRAKAKDADVHDEELQWERFALTLGPNTIPVFFDGEERDTLEHNEPHITSTISPSPNDPLERTFQRSEIE